MLRSLAYFQPTYGHHNPLHEFNGHPGYPFQKPYVVIRIDPVIDRSIETERVEHVFRGKTLIEPISELQFTRAVENNVRARRADKSPDNEPLILGTLRIPTTEQPFSLLSLYKSSLTTVWASPFDNSVELTPIERLQS